MHLSIIPLAQQRGTVVVTRRGVTEYAIRQLDFTPRQLMATRIGRLSGLTILTSSLLGLGSTAPDATIPYIEGEGVAATRSRAIAAVRMQGYDPRLRRDLSTMREVMTVGGYGAGKTAAQRDELARRTDSGIILPGAP